MKLNILITRVMVERSKDEVGGHLRGGHHG